MRVFIVLAHPSPGSLNTALQDIAVETLSSAGHTVTISDLYAMAFKATANSKDFTHPLDARNFDCARKQAVAYENGSISGDIAVEQEKRQAAAVAIFRFLLWRYSVSTVPKGWLERVLSMGFAHGRGRMFDRGGWLASARSAMRQHRCIRGGALSVSISCRHSWPTTSFGGLTKTARQ